MLPEATVAITRHDETDDALCAALACLCGQQGVTLTVLVLDQCASEGVAAYCDRCSTDAISLQYLAIEPCGIARARNLGLAHCQTDALLFSEPDARVAPDWARHLIAALDAGAAVVGGRIVPIWEAPPPFVTGASIIRDLYSLLDQGPGRQRTQKIVGCSFAISRRRLGPELALFDENFGRSPGTLRGGEEMQLCEGAHAAGLEVSYEGRSLTHHVVAARRLNYRWLLRRLYAAGKSRRQRGGAPRPTHPPRLDPATLASLPLYSAYVLGWLRALAAGSSKNEVTATVAERARGKDAP